MSEPEPLSDFDRRLRKALTRAIHDGGSSVEAVAAAVHKSPKHCYAAFHPYPESAGDGGRAVPSLHWLVPLINLTGRIEPLQMIAEAVGYDLVALPSSGTEDVRAAYFQAMGEAGDIARDLQEVFDKAGPGGEGITDEEWDKLERDAREAQAKFARIRRPKRGGK